MKRRGIVLIAALLVGIVLSACGDSKKEVTMEEVKAAIEKRLSDGDLGKYGFIVQEVDITAMEHKGDKISPIVLTRFQSSANLKEDLYSSRNKYIMDLQIIRKVFDAKTPIMFYGTTKTKLKSEKWNTTVSKLKTEIKKDLKARWRPLSYFGEKCVIEGSQEEKALMAKIDKLKAEKEAKKQRVLDELRKKREAKEAEDRKKREALAPIIEKRLLSGAGHWKGEIDCGRNTHKTPFEIDLRSNGVALFGEFTCYKFGQKGTYMVSGTIDENNNIKLNAGEWLSTEIAYSKHGLEGKMSSSGNVISGEKSAYGCRSFRLEKIISGE